MDTVPSDQHCWVCFKKHDAQSILSGRKTYWAFHPTNRNIANLILNFILALCVFLLERPTHIISTGAGVAVPFFVIAGIFGIRSCYIESFARIDSPSVTGKICYRLADRFIYQWDDLERFYPKGIFGGSIYWSRYFLFSASMRGHLFEWSNMQKCFRTQDIQCLFRQGIRQSVPIYRMWNRFPTIRYWNLWCHN